MNMPTSYPTPKVPMYTIAIVEPTGRLADSGYKTRSELLKLIDRLELFTKLVLDEDTFITQSVPMLNGNTFIIITTYLQISNKDE